MDKSDNYLYIADMHYESFSVKRLARVFCHKGWSWEPNEKMAWVDDSGKPVQFNFDLWTVLQGAGKIKTPEGTYDIKGGDCFILRGDQHYQATHDPSDPLVVFAIHYDYLDKAGNIIRPQQTQLYRHIQYMDFFTNMLNRIETAWIKGDLQTACDWMKVCMIEIERQDRDIPRTGINKEQLRLIDRISNDIVRDPSRKWLTKELAAKTHCTPRHFSRLFKEFNGVSPQSFVMNVRIEAAKGLLYSSNYTIGHIAETVGFCDIYYFSRQFKRRVGMTPSQYRIQS